jgi:molecular chaperone DnaK
VTIENALSRFERDERDAARNRLERLWQDSESDWGEPEDVGGPEEMIEEEPTGPPELVSGPREGQRETVQARALLEKCERLLPNLQPEDKAEVERLMTNVRTALTDRKWDQLTTACNELTDILFYLEE